jgi:hypothetical protein
VWEWTWDRFICSVVAPTTPTTHHSRQALTLITKVRNEILPPSCHRSGKQRERGPTPTTEI